MHRDMCQPQGTINLHCLDWPAMPILKAVVLCILCVAIATHSILHNIVSIMVK